MEYATACGPIRLDGTYMDFGINVLPCEQAVITEHPSTVSQAVCAGEQITALSVTTTGTALTYQWYKNITASNDGGTAIAGATSANYTPSSASSGTFYYYCIVGGRCSQPVPSNISGAITVTAPPVAGTILGDNILYLGYFREMALTEDADEGGIWESSDTDVVSVDAFGLVTGLSSGTATISYTVVGSGGCTDAKAEYQITVLESSYFCFGASDAVYSFEDPNGDMSPENAVGFSDFNYAAIGQNEYIALDLTGGNLSLGNTVTITWSKWAGEAFAPDAYMYESQDGINWQFIKTDKVYNTSFTEYNLPVKLSTRYLKIENKSSYWLYVKSVTFNYPCSGCLIGTLTLTTDNKDQIICPNSAISNIIYEVGGGATGATVSGLPNGVGGTYSNGQVIISGSPSDSESGTFNYTVSTIGTQSGCDNATAMGTITITSVPDANFALPPSNGEICSGENAEFNLMGTANAIVDFSLDGGATTETVSLDGSGSAKVTVPGATENQEISLTNVYVGSCSKTLDQSATVIVKPLPLVSILGNTFIEVGTTTALSPASGGTWTSNNPAVATVNNEGIVIGTAPGTTKFTFTDNLSGCSATTANVNVITDVCTGYAVDFFSELGYVDSPEFVMGIPDGNVASIYYESTLILDLTGGNYAIGSPVTVKMFINKESNPRVIIYESSDPSRINWTPVYTGILSNTEPINYSLDISDNTRFLKIENTDTRADVLVYVDGVTYNYPCPGCSNGKLTLTSGNNEQTICLQALMDDIVYNVGGGATGAEATGLPNGVTGEFSNGIFTISGTPTVAGTFNYSVSTTGTPSPCNNSSSDGIITVTDSPSVPGEISGPTAVCAGGIGINYSVAAVPGATSYNWTLPEGAEITDGSETNSVIVNFGSTSGSVSVTATNSCGTSLPGTLEVTVNTELTPSVTITSSDSDNKLCSGQIDPLFTAHPVNTDGGTVSYQWYLNKITYSAWNNAQWMGPDLEFGDEVRCEIIVTKGTCSVKTVSNIIIHEVYSQSDPSVAIESDVSGTFCYGTNVIFTATPLNTGGGTVAYQWKLNDELLGSNQNKYTSDELDNGDRISCDIKVTDAACFTEKTASSNEITVSLYNRPEAGSINGTPHICVGSSATFSVTGNSIPGFWNSFDESLATVDQSGNVTAVSAGSATIVYYVFTTEPCKDNDMATFEVTVHALTVVDFTGSASINTGETTTLSPTYGGTWTSSNPAVATVTDAGMVTGVAAGTAIFTFTDATTGCTATTGEITVTDDSYTNTQTFTTNGTFTIPDGVTAVNIKAWGGGGGGSYRYETDDTDPENMIYGPGAGGGGGGFCGGTINVTPGEILDITVGTGGYGGNDLDTEGSTGGDSEVRDYSGTWWITAFGGSGGYIVSEGAEGGSGGNGNYYPITLNITTYNGGNGSAGVLSENGVGYGGGGGGGAGDSQNGSDAGNETGGAGGTNFGGNGGDYGSDGIAYGGGGGGNNNEDYSSSGNGANGAVIIEWTLGTCTPPVPTFAESPSSPQCIDNDVTYTTQPDKTNYEWNIPGTENTDYEISSGGTSLDNTVTLIWLTEGSKTVTVNYTEDCEGVTPASSTITIDEADVSIMIIGHTTFCEGGSVVLQASEASSYLWSNGETTQEIKVTTSGDYYVTIINENGCSASTSAVTVTVNPMPTISGISIDNESSCYDPDADPTLIISGLIPGENTIFYAVNEEHIGEPLILEADEYGVATQSFDLGVGTFVFSIDEIRVNGGCKINPSVNNSVTWTVYAIPEANAGSGGDVCGLGFVLDATASVGTGTWTQKSGPGTADFNTNSNDADATVIVTEYGTYVFRWTEENGPCSDFDEVTVTFYQQPVADAGDDQSQCDNSNFTISAGSLTKAAIIGPSGIWEFVGDYGVAKIENNYSETTTVTDVPFDQDITLRWTVTNGTCIDFDDVVLRNNSLPEASSVILQACDNGNETADFTLTDADATVIGVQTGVTVTYRATLTDADNDENALASPYNSGSKIVYARLENDATGCYATSEVTLTVNPQPIITSFTVDNAKLCVADGYATVRITFGGLLYTDNTINVTYLIRGNLVGTITTDIEITQSMLTENLGSCYYELPLDCYPASYQLIVNSITANGCTTTFNESEKPTVSWNIYLEPTVRISELSYCGKTILTVYTDVVSASFSWYKYIGSELTPISGATGSTLEVTESGTYSVEITNTETGCSNGTWSDVTVYPLPTASISGDLEACGGTILTAETDDESPSYIWRRHTETGYYFIPEATGSSLEVTESGTYSVIVINTETGCSKEAKVIVTINPLPEVDAGTYSAVCEDAFNVPLVGSPTGGVWKGTGVSEDQTTGYVFDPTGNVGDNTLTYTYTDDNGCSNSDDATIHVDAFYLADAGEDQSQCNNSTFTISAGSLTKAAIIDPSGIWDFVGEHGTAQITNANSATTTVTNVPFDQDITLQWTVTNGTCIDFDDVVLRNNSLPTVEAGTFDDVCVDAIDVALPTGGVWLGEGVGGNQTDGYFFDPTGHVGDNTLTFTVTDSEIGCTNSEEAIIHVNDLPTVDAGTYAAVCANGADVELAGTPIGGTWSGIGVTGNYFDPSAGTQTVTYTYEDANGCTNSDDALITINPLPIVDAGTYTAVCIDGPDVELIGTPIGGIWSGTGVTGNYFDPSAGTQTVTYTWEDTNGCTNSDDALITVNPLPKVDAGTYAAICEDADDVVLVGSPTGGIWEGTGVSGDLEAGYIFDASGHVGYNTLTYTYTDDNGCSNSAQTTIRVYYLPNCLLYEPGSVEGDPVLPNSSHFYVTHGTSSYKYKWTIEGNGRIKGYDDKELVEVIAGENCNEPYTLSLTVTNNVTQCSSTCSKEVNVNDTEGPYLIDPLNTSASLDSKDNNWCLEVADAFDGSTLQYDVKALYSDNWTAVSAICTGKSAGADNSNCIWTFTYHFTVQDECFNSTTCDVTYSGGDTEEPVLKDPLVTAATLNSENMNQCLGEADAYDAAELQKAVEFLYQDNCSNATAKYTGKTSGDSNSDCNWIFTYHFTVSDECGKSTVCDVVYSGGDTEKPVALCQDIKIQLDKDGFAAIDNDAVNNGSNDNCSASLNFATDITSFGCTDVGANLVVLTVTDDCGKFSTCQATVTVEDNIAPALTCPATSPFTRSTDLNCNYYTISGTEFDATAFDACCTPTMSYSCQHASVISGCTLTGVQLPVGTHIIDWTAEDVNGNKSTGQIEVTVEKRSLILTYTGDANEQYSDQVSLSALLEDEANAPVSGKTIRFTIGTQSVTDDNRR